MKKLFAAFERKLTPYRRKFLHLVFMTSLGCFVGGWSLLEQLGPMSVILPAVIAIGAGLSEVEHLSGSLLSSGGEPVGWTTETKKAVMPRD